MMSNPPAFYPNNANKYLKITGKSLLVRTVTLFIFSHRGVLGQHLIFELAAYSRQYIILSMLLSLMGYGCAILTRARSATKC